MNEVLHRSRKKTHYKDFVQTASEYDLICDLAFNVYLIVVQIREFFKWLILIPDKLNFNRPKMVD